MITIYNRGDKKVSDFVNGQLLVVPANGSVSTSPKKAHELVERYPQELSLVPPSLYSSAEFAAIAECALPVTIEAALLVLMRGERLDVKAFKERVLAARAEVSVPKMEKLTK